NLDRVQVTDPSLATIYGAIFNNPSGALRRPLANATFIANQLVGGQDAFSYKLVNLFLHVACGLLVYVLALQLLSLLSVHCARKLRWIALCTAALWTVHPLQVSTVLYV